MRAEDGSGSISRFGYAQELFRSMGGFSNFAISFSIISILTGAGTLYGYGLAMGGPLEMTLGWPLGTLAMLCVAASMAELCSAYPTSGAMYHWAAALTPARFSPFLPWFVAWFNVFGLVAEIAGINYSCAQFIMPFLRIEATPLNLFLLFAFVTLNQAVLNHYGVRLVAILNDLSVTVHIVGVLAIVGVLFWMAPLQPVSFLAKGVNSNGYSPYWWAFFLGLLQAHWTYTGFDGSAHMAEETKDPRRHAPWGLVMSVAVSGVVGYLLLIALTLAIQDIPAVLAAKEPTPIAIVQIAAGPRLGATLGALASMAMWFCGMSTLASGSRTLYALARDKGTPKAELLRKVDAKHGTPAWSIWVVAIFSIATMAWAEAIPAVTSLSTVALYISYVIPIILAWRARRPGGDDWSREAIWNMRGAGRWVNAAAVIYTVFICFVLIMPPNTLAGKTTAGLVVLLLVLWYTRARHYYKGPEWTVGLTAAGTLENSPTL